MRRRKEKVILERIMVEEYAAEGKSLAKVDGKVVFIENAVPGDIVDIQLARNKKDWAEGRAVRFHAYSGERVNPFCTHFGLCGGCQWQMLPYGRQLQYKEKQVSDALQRIGKVRLPAVSPILGAAETTHYRNKMEYTFGTREFTREPPRRIQKDQSFGQKQTFRSGGDKQEAILDVDSVSCPASDKDPGLAKVVGFHARGFFDKIVDIQCCHLQAEPSNEIRLAVKQFAIDNDFSFYDIRQHTGFLRTMQVRLCTTGELMVNIVVGERDDSKTTKMLEFVAGSFPSISTLLYTVNEKRNDSLHDLEPVLYSGSGYVMEHLEDFRFKIGPKSFFQTNTKQAEQLYRVAREFAMLSGEETVYDLYCGTGSLGIFASRQAKRIVGVEMIPEAIDDARENAALNQLKDSRFFAGDVVEICHADFFREHGRPDVIITDPPRAGMHEKLLRKILDMEAPVLVYVSCNPATQARDINLLDEKYNVERIQPVDMFPHTLHIENVVQLRLRN